MAELESKYIAHNVESSWYNKWLEHNLFHSEPNKQEPFTIVIPPPNVTGVLHMGHMLNETIQDVLCRKNRMENKNVCWVPGTDHASIATEAKVVNLLKEKGIDKKDLTRDEFLSYAWAWKEDKGGTILKQLKFLGCSCDWQRTKFTMDEDMSKAVTKVFCDLYDKGLIYRGVRMVNWDPKALTAVSDEEVIHKEQDSQLYYLRYRIVGKDDYIVVATTRPETIMGDTAVCVNPKDERYSYLKGQKVIVPLVNRQVDIIFDEYVDMSFGTGCLKITPCHDINDYNIGIKHKLDSINIFNDDGTLNQNGLQYQNMDRFACRKQIVKDLQANDLIEKIEPYHNTIGLSERTSTPIEPKLSMQWFVKMDSMAQKALKVVQDKEILFYPEKFINTYRHWLENVKDWCISRQLWWGHRIPAYYLPNKELVVAIDKASALEKANLLYPNEHYTESDLVQDEDVLDTWFSSWLWPMSCFNGVCEPDNEQFRYYFPTSDLVTAPDILFFWVARMIMASLEFDGRVPFKNVYFTGTVRDKLGRKMSKSLGNSPDPLLLIDKYGADGVRMGMLMVSPAGGDLLFDESYCEQGRNFTNKIWNALRLIKGFKVEDKPTENKNILALKWFTQKQNEILYQIEDDFKKYRLSECLKSLYSFVWEDFCSWYLEIIKPNYGDSIDKKTYQATIEFLDNIVRMLHPFMPFVTEEIYHKTKDRKDEEFIILSSYPKPTQDDKEIEEQFSFIKELITTIRQTRNSKNIPPKTELNCYIKKDNYFDTLTRWSDIIVWLTNCKISFVDTKPESCISFMVRTSECYIEYVVTVNKEEALKKIIEQIDYYQRFAQQINKKLSNDKFVANAPEKVVALERKKLSDCQTKIIALEEEKNNLEK